MPVNREPTDTLTLADKVRARDRHALAQIGTAPIIPLNTNLVQRPWAGRQISEYKGLAMTAAQPWGEAFEICAFADDDEANAHPSIVPLADGSEVGLPELLAVAGPAILGDDFVAQHGHQFPLLPKTLDVGQLLSVQAHPAGCTEVYIIIDADPGATMRLGFNRDIDAKKFAPRLKQGRELQTSLLHALGKTVDVEILQATLARNFARQAASADSVIADLNGSVPAASSPKIIETLRKLKILFWEVLDSLNEIPVVPGQVIYNANPPGVAAAAGRVRSAEVHALGNPEGKKVLALEIRRPAPTYRAWDHVRFPLRDIDVDKSLAALNLQSTRAADFIVTLQPVPGRRGVFRSVEDASFVVDHLRPEPGIAVEMPDDTPVHTLHVIRGGAAIRTADGRPLASLKRGQSALMPASIGGYQLTHIDGDTEVVMVTIPLSATAKMPGGSGS